MDIPKMLTLFGVALAVPLMAAAQAAPSPSSGETVADFHLVVLGYFDAETLADFHTRVREYDELRRVVERTGPPLSITEDADEITRFERWLTARLRERRGSSDRGQIFPVPMEAQLKKLFIARVDADTLQAIMDDGPGEFDVDINETYDKYRSLATMPPNILLVLPDLPKDMEYRFVGRHLILRDVRANMVVDEILFALICEKCVIAPEESDDGGESLERKKAPSK
jgi:hypothetical protein